MLPLPQRSHTEFCIQFQHTRCVTGVEGWKTLNQETCLTEIIDLELLETQLTTKSQRDIEHLMFDHYNIMKQHIIHTILTLSRVRLLCSQTFQCLQD